MMLCRRLNYNFCEEIKLCNMFVHLSELYAFHHKNFTYVSIRQTY